MDVRPWVLTVLVAMTWVGGDARFRTLDCGTARPFDEAAWIVSPSTVGIEHGDGTASVVRSGQDVVHLRAEFDVAGLDSASDACMGRPSALILRARLRGADSDPTLFAGGQRSLLYVARTKAGVVTEYEAVEFLLGFTTDRRLYLPVGSTSPGEMLRLGLVLHHAGAWGIGEVGVAPGVENPWYGVTAGALASLWLALGVWFLAPLFRRGRIRRPSVLVLAVLVVVVGTLASRPFVVAPLIPIADFLVIWQDVWGVSRLTGFMLDAGHGVGFAVLTFAVLMLRRELKLGYFVALSCCVLMAFATEALQRHRPGRSPELGDIAVDLVGIALGTLLFGVAVALVRRFRRPIRALRHDAAP